MVLAITYLSLISGELVPKRLALSGPEAVASRVAGPMRLLSAITTPAVWLLSVSTEGVLRMLGARRTGEPPVSEQEVEILMEEGAREGVFEEEERDLVRRALRLDDRPVRDLMTPRPGVVWLDADDPKEEIFEGLVTLTDVLEALIGEVPDEEEPAEVLIVRREDGSLMVDVLLGANDLKEHLGLGWLPREEDADYHTVGSMVMDTLGRVPAEGDRFDWEGYFFEVLDMDGRRVDKLLVTPRRDVDPERAP